MNNFQSFGLSQAMLDALAKLNFKAPTPIQEKTIPLALEGRDIIGSAQTGTGKTAAFGIPLAEHLLQNEERLALVITPTRELAAQVLKSLLSLLPKDFDRRSALLIGGDSMFRQLKSLSSKKNLIVGTPGRIFDHIERETLDLSKTSFLVLDETDRMLDMGFSIQIDRIVAHIPKKRQTLLFSATIPTKVESLCKKYLSEPTRIAVESEKLTAENINQEFVHVGEEEKYSTLVAQIEKREGSIIVFVKTKHGAEKMAQKLKAEKVKVAAIHGDMRNNKRVNVIKDFANNRVRVMVATDVAARGLDIPSIEHVINYDLPQCPEDYVHRIGRSGRAGNSGQALCLITPSDRLRWKTIDRFLNPGATPVREKNFERPFKQKSFGFSGNRSRNFSSNKRGGNDRFDRNYRFDRNDRAPRPDFSDSGDRFDRTERSQVNSRTQGNNRFERSDRPRRPGFGNRNDRFDRNNEGSNRFERSDRESSGSSLGDRSNRFDRGERSQQTDRPGRSDRDYRGGGRSGGFSKFGPKKPSKNFSSYSSK